MNVEHAESLMQEALHTAWDIGDGPIVLADQGWRFEWSNTRTALGDCAPRRSGGGTIRLSLPNVQINSEETIQNTILHEVAHALAGHEAGHGPKWKRVARLVGAKPERCNGDAEWVPAPWVGTCPVCGHEQHLHRPPKRVRSCGECSRTFSLDYVMEWRHSGRRISHEQMSAKTYKRDILTVQRMRESASAKEQE